MLDAELLEQIEIGFVAVIMIAGNLRRVAILDLAREQRKPVPNRFALAIQSCRSLDLSGGGRRAPHEAIGELGYHPEVSRCVAVMTVPALSSHAPATTPNSSSKGCLVNPSRTVSPGSRRRSATILAVIQAISIPPRTHKSLPHGRL